MNKISALIATCCFLFAAPAQSASFIADAVQIRGDNVSHAKMYWLDGNVRFEYQEDDDGDQEEGRSGNDLRGGT